MINDENVKLLNLCMDESGIATLGINRQRYFLLTAVIISPDQQELASLLFAKWRRKYLTKPNKSFHAADFFEDFEDDYKKASLKLPRTFTKAVDDLLDILKHLEFQAKVHYVDLIALRTRLGVKKVPVFKAEFKDDEEKQKYKQERKKFEAYFKDHHLDSKDIPYLLPLFESFKYHQQAQEEAQKNDEFNRTIKGFISFESLGGGDVKAVESFHRVKEKIHLDYRERIIGINFPTKNSLDGGIEIADLISYVSCQTLRKTHRLAHELENISKEKKIKLTKMRNFMREKCKIELIDVTNKTIPKTKKAS